MSTRRAALLTIAGVALVLAGCKDDPADYRWVLWTSSATTEDRDWEPFMEFRTLAACQASPFAAGSTRTITRCMPMGVKP